MIPPPAPAPPTPESRRLTHYPKANTLSKGLQLEVRTRRAPRLLAYNIRIQKLQQKPIGHSQQSNFEKCSRPSTSILF